MQHVAVSKLKGGTPHSPISSPLHKSSPISSMETESIVKENQTPISLVNIDNIVNSDDEYVIQTSDMYNERSKKGLPAYVVSRILRERRSISAEPFSQPHQHNYQIPRKTASPNNFHVDDVLQHHHLDTDSSFERMHKKQMDERNALLTTDDSWSRLRARMSAVKKVQELHSQVATSLQQLEAVSAETTADTAESMEMLGELLKKSSKLDFGMLMTQNREKMDDIFENHEQIIKSRKSVLKDLQQWFTDSFNKSNVEDGNLNFGDEKEEFFLTSIKEDSEKWHTVLEGSKDKIDEMLTGMKKKSEKLVEMQATIKDIVQYVEKASSQTPNTVLSKKISDLDKTVISLKVELHEQTKKCALAESKCKVLEEMFAKEGKKMDAKAQVAQREVDMLRKQIESLEGDRSRAAAEHNVDIQRLKTEQEKLNATLRIEAHDKQNSQKYSNLLKIDVANKNKEIESKIERINELHNDIAARDGIIGDLNKQMKQIYLRQKQLLQSIQDKDGFAFVPTSESKEEKEEKLKMKSFIEDLQSQVKELETNRNMRAASMRAIAIQTDEETIAVEEKKQREEVLTQEPKPYTSTNEYLVEESTRENEELKKQIKEQQAEIEKMKATYAEHKATVERQAQQQKQMHNQTKAQLKNLLGALKKRETDRAAKQNGDRPITPGTEIITAQLAAILETSDIVLPKPQELKSFDIEIPSTPEPIRVPEKRVGGEREDINPMAMSYNFERGMFKQSLEMISPQVEETFDEIRPNMDVTEVSQLLAAQIKKSKEEGQKMEKQLQRYKKLIHAQREKLTESQMKLNEKEEKQVEVSDNEYKKVIIENQASKRALAYINNRTETYIKDLIGLYPIEMVTDEEASEMHEDEDLRIETNTVHNALIMSSIRRYRVLYHSMRKFIEYLFDAGCKGPHEQHMRFKYQQMKQEVEAYSRRDRIDDPISANTPASTSSPVGTKWKSGKQKPVQKSVVEKAPAPKYSEPAPVPPKYEFTSPVKASNNPEVDQFKDKSNELIKRNKEINTQRISAIFNKMTEKMKLQQLLAEFHALKHSSGKPLNMDVLQGIIDEQKKVVKLWEMKVKQLSSSKRSTADDALRTLTNFVGNSTEPRAESPIRQFIEEERSDSRGNDRKTVKLPYLLKIDTHKSGSTQPRSHTAPHD